MRKLFTIAVCAALALPMFATSVGANFHGKSESLFPYMTKFRGENRILGKQDLSVSKSNADGARVDLMKAPELKPVETSDMVGYLESPQGAIWTYTYQYAKDAKGNINGFSMRVYDENFELIGDFSDELELREGETRIADISIAPEVSKKFFNVDNNYEIMVGVAANTLEYVNHYRTFIYQIVTGPTEPVAEFEGYPCSAVNTSTNSWTESFYVTFLTEVDTETPEINGYPNAMDYRFLTYRKASYNGMEDPILDVRFPSLVTLGDEAVPFVVSQYEGKPYFALNYLKYSWYENPNDYENDNPTLDNEIIIDLYCLEGVYDATAKKYSTTRIPTTATYDNLMFVYLGAFGYNDDLDFRIYGDGTPAYYITRALSINGGDDKLYTYELYDVAAKGEDAYGVKKVTFGKNITSALFMSDIHGYDPQAMFVKEDGDSFTFDFVNLHTGEIEATIPYTFADESLEYHMNIDVDRVASSSGYLYAVAQNQGRDDENGNTHTYVVFANKDGYIESVDDINLGENVDYAQLYTSEGAWNPYLFNLDDNREYMALVKRKVGSAIEEQLVVVSTNPEKGELLRVRPDATMGILTSISLLNVDKENPKLMVIYVNQDPGNWKYTSTYYDLPFTLFEEGEGTIENPYIINSAGGLMAISKAPAAHYAIGNDIDCSGAQISINSFSFSGSIDGRNHVISDMTLSGHALIPTVLGTGEATSGVIKDIKFKSPRFYPTADRQGILCGDISYGKVSNVRIFDGYVESNSDAAGIVGSASLSTVIELCSFDGEIKAHGSVGGIAVSTFTDASISACAVRGKIAGGEEVGGILGNLSSNGAGVSDCHVSADIEAKSIVGGVVGIADRHPIVRNHVEGTITATENQQWGGGAKVGGVVGSLLADYSSLGNSGESDEDGDVVAATAVVKNNFVNLTSISYPEIPEGSYASQNTSVHRVVGYSMANEADQVGYDSEANKPLYGEAYPADAGIVDNYVISTLAIIDSAVEDGLLTTEGKSVAAADLNKDFFKNNLGFAYGSDTVNPWSESASPQAPKLYFESGLLVVAPQTVSVWHMEEVALEVTLVGEELSEDMLSTLTVDFDESILEMTSSSALDNGCKLVFRGLKVGSSKVTIGLAGQTTEAMVKVIPNGSGVDDVELNKSSLAYVGGEIVAQGCAIEIYSTSGVKMLSAENACNVSDLQSGIYIAVATTVDGQRSTLKFGVR